MYALYKRAKQVSIIGVVNNVLRLNFAMGKPTSISFGVVFDVFQCMIPVADFVRWN